LVASFLARMRGHHEPERSSTRAQMLDQFIRRCTEYVADHGNDPKGDDTDKEVKRYRDWLNQILEDKIE